jgi:C4-dicarboxylate-specific signal transduction histidine kinase
MTYCSPLQNNFDLFLRTIESAHEFLNKSPQIDDLFITDQLAELYDHIKLDDVSRPYLESLQQEINEHKKIECELNRSEEFLDLVLKSGRMHCWDWDIQTNKMTEFGYMTTTSSRTSNATDYSFDVFIESIVLDDREQVKKQITQALTQGDLELEFEYRSSMINNTMQWVNLRGKMFYDHQKPQRMIGVEVIITEPKNLERLALQQREKLDHVARTISLSEIKNTLAKELTNPFACINSHINDCIQLLERGAQEKEPIIKAMRKAIESVGHAGKIIHHMKNFYRKTEMHYETILINDLIKNAVSMIQYENIHDTPATVLFDLQDQSFIVDVNKIHMKQVLLNLMRTSIKAMHLAKITHPTIIIYCVKKNPHTVIVSIEHNGPSINVDVNEMLFKSSFTINEDIAGMELAFSHTIIEAHGGQLSVQKVHGGGAFFQFTLPILIDEHHEQAI